MVGVVGGGVVLRACSYGRIIRWSGRRLSELTTDRDGMVWGIRPRAQRWGWQWCEPGCRACRRGWGSMCEFTVRCDAPIGCRRDSIASGRGDVGVAGSGLLSCAGSVVAIDDADGEGRV
jgi:hypothetical protein